MKNSGRRYRMPENSAGGFNWFIVKVALFIVAVLILIMTVKLIFDYTALLEERKALEADLQKLKNEKRELEYYLNSPIDDYYIRKFAWDLYRLVPSGEKIYVSDPTK